MRLGARGSSLSGGCCLKSSRDWGGGKPPGVLPFVRGVSFSLEPPETTPRKGRTDNRGTGLGSLSIGPGGGRLVVLHEALIGVVDSP